MTDVPSLALGVIAIASILGLLYLGKALLVPVTMAVVLSFALSPFVQMLRRLGLGHVSSVLVAVTLTGLSVAILAGVIAIQAIGLASHFPSYQGTFRDNMKALRSETLDRLMPTLDAAARAFDPLDNEPLPDSSPRDRDLRSSRVTGTPIPVEIRQPKATATQLLQIGVSLAWGPIGTAGIVVIVLIFVLLEQEALRDRFIRLVGGSDLRATTTAINDAGERLSRYLVRQFIVNAGVGVAIWGSLTAAGLPSAALVATLTAVLRFVPFVGVPIAGIVAAMLALAAAPGWTPLLFTLATFGVVQLVTSQVIEPRLYGHATGLSPLSVVLATLCWGWLWGPVGVIISTPLTLCLAVAGRYAESLGFLEVVLGDAPALSLPQRFYQRALSGDAAEIAGDAREFLKRKPLAAYCDQVLMPALQLGRADLMSGAISQQQQVELRSVIVRVVESLGGSPRSQLFSRSRSSVLDDVSPGRLLRSRRIERQRQAIAQALARGDLLDQSGPLVLCIGLGSLGDDLATELLVRILRELHIDARHLTVDDLEAPRPADVQARVVSAFCIISVSPGSERETGEKIARRIRDKMPKAFLVALLLRDVLSVRDASGFGDVCDRIAESFGDAALELSERAADREALRGDAAELRIPSPETGAVANLP